MSSYCNVCETDRDFHTPVGYLFPVCVVCGFPEGTKITESVAIRHNKDKLRVDLIPTELTEEVAKVLTFGATKYSPDNWKGFNKEQQKEILGSLLRHILEYQKGNKFDSESGLHHLAHAACNIAFILYFENQKGE